MREILFRGKTKSGMWVYGYYMLALIRGEKTHVIVPLTSHMDVTLDKEQYIIDPKTVGQCVGITDKNGKEIFEGDIVTGIAYSQEWIGTIIWIKEIASFGLYHGHEIAFENCSILKRAAKGMNDEFTAEIIGNIHDNPDLLEVM